MAIFLAPITFWLSVLPHIFGPPLTVFILLNLLDERSNSSAVAHILAKAGCLQSSWIRSALYILVTPVYLWGRNALRNLGHEIAARSRGAKLFPVISGKWPFGLDLVYELKKTIEWEYAGEILLKKSEDIGSKTFILRFMGEDKIFTREPRYIKQILAGNFPNYVKGKDLFGAATRSVLGTGVFNADGELWKFHRNLARPFFTRDRISDFEIFAKHADAVIRQMKEAFTEGRPVDFQDVCARFTLDSATEFLFGACVDSISEPPLVAYNAGFTKSAAANTMVTEVPVTNDGATASFVRSFASAQEIIGLRVRVGYTWPAFETRDATEEHVVKIREYLEPILERALQRKKDNKLSGPVQEGGEKVELDEGTTLLDYLVLQTEDKDVIRDQILNMLIAGRDTTACLLTFSVYALSQNPKALAQLRAEILQVVGPNQVPTYDAIRELKYLRAVLNETLRLFPPVPMNYREAIHEDIWTAADGTRYYIPPHTSIIYDVMHMHRETDFWGDKALEFDPERWIDERRHKLTQEPFAFLPFNAGPRICLGQQFAYNEASFMLVRLLQNFESIALRPDAQPFDTLPASKSWDPKLGRNGVEKIWPRTHLTLYSMGGMWCTMKEAKDVVTA